MTTLTHLSGTATVSSWDEEPGWDTDAPTPRLAHATVVFLYRGDLEVTSICQSVMHYADGVTGVTGFTAAAHTKEWTWHLGGEG